MQKLIAVLLISFFLQFSATAQNDCTGNSAYAELDVNNVRAGVLQAGSLWWDGQDGKYHLPDDGSEVTAIFAGGVWVTAMLTDSTVRSAVSTYGHGGANRYDFFPGPLDPATGGVFTDGCTNWNKHFTVYHSEKETHISDFNADGVIDNPQANIYGWPGKNNPHFSEQHGFGLPEDLELAPFVDTDGDGDYNPAAGDYPDTKGHQTVWWVFNDAADIHTQSNGFPLGVEVQATAYAFQSFDEDINHATFYDFEMGYYGNEPLSDLSFGLWTDVDLGCFTDDYFGFDSLRNTAFYYNEDVTDGYSDSTCLYGIPSYGNQVPMLGIRCLNEEPVQSFTYYHQGTLCDISATVQAPAVSKEYHNYMNGMWRDGNPFTIGDHGYDYFGDSTATNYAFHSNPATSPMGWSMCSAAGSFYTLTNSGCSHRTVMSSEAENPQNGTKTTFSYAVFADLNPSLPCPDSDVLGGIGDKIAAFDCVISSTTDLSGAAEISISPNPAQSEVLISLNNSDLSVAEVTFFDAAGKLIFSKENANQFNAAFDISHLATGVYFVKIITNDGGETTEKLIVQRE